MNDEIYVLFYWDAWNIKILKYRYRLKLIYTIKIKYYLLFRKLIFFFKIINISFFYYYYSKHNKKIGMQYNIYDIK